MKFITHSPEETRALGGRLAQALTGGEVVAFTGDLGAGKTAFVSGMVHWLFFPGTALLGASGIVFMMIVMSSLAGMKNGCIPITLILVLVLYIGGEIVDGVMLKDNISQLSHIVGGICGAFLGISMRR